MRVFLFLTMMLVSLEGATCIAPVLPVGLGTDDDPYDVIRIGVVKDVYPSGRVLRELRSQISGESDIPGNWAEAHIVTIEVEETMRGYELLADQFVIAGCGIREAEVGWKGLFFVYNDEMGRRAIPIYARNSRGFREWLSRAKSATDS